MILRKATTAYILILTSLTLIPVSVYLTTPMAHAMIPFASYQDLQEFVHGGGCRSPAPSLDNRGGPTTGLATAGPASQSNGASSQSPTHSETNQQVSGVDELDTVKNDGQYIYTISNNTVVVVRAYPVTNAQLVSRISILNQTIDGIFLSGNRLAIVSEAPRTVYNMYGACGISTFVGGSTRPAYRTSYYVPIRPQVQNTSISVYDLTTRSSPSLQTMVTINGTFIGARQIGTFAYLVTSTPASANQTLPFTV